MGVSVHANKKRDVDAEKHLKRLHHTVPFIESPLQGADHANLVFSQRHEANAVELFFDLFFAANLATFTTYHSITDTTYLLGYMGFFGILWSCWFQVTLHDVRFARDSIYERVCKTINFIVFVGLALVGSGFNPGGDKGSNTNFRILCYTLVLSRALFVVQYAVVFFYTARAGYSKLFLPLGLHIIIYAVAATAFGAMTPAFRTEEQKHNWIYVMWYIIMLVEAIGVLAISCFWKMLSFKKTHLMERMSLLTLIVIGEGAIGVTKTVSRMMGKGGLDVESCFLVMCIIGVLVLLWALYFDNFPHGHYGTIRQQIWSLLHFPLQLAIVGVVEGSQQVALARYIIKSYDKIAHSVVQYCHTENLDGVALRDKLSTLVAYFQFESKLETYGYSDYANHYVYLAGNETGICAPDLASQYFAKDLWPEAFTEFTMTMFDGIYIGLGMKLPVKQLEKKAPIEIAVWAWRTVYVYYWSSFCILMACSCAFLFLIRRHRIDIFDFVSVSVRLVMVAVGAALLAVISNDTGFYKFIASPAVLPCCLVLLFIVLVFDRASAAWSNWRLKKSGEPYALEYDASAHGHGSEHGSPHLRDSAFEPLKGETDRMSKAWSIHSEREVFSAETAYQPPTPGQTTYAMQPLMSPPPLMSPLTPTPGLGGHASGGYVPVNAQRGSYGA